jgi:hypothetical protein
LLEDLGLRHREVDRAAAARDRRALEVDLDAVAAQDRPPPRGRGAAGSGRAPTAEDGADAGRELAEAEGLGDVVVRAELEAADHVDVLRAGREEDHRRGRALGAEALEEREAVLARQHDVEEDEVEAARGRAEEDVARGLRRADALGLEALVAEVEADPVRHRALVLDDQNASFGRAGHGSSAPRV